MMRRKEREVKEQKKIDEIIQKCHCIRIGLNDNEKVYIVPVNFGFTYENDKRVFYFHGAKYGRKAELIYKNDYASFEMDCEFKFIENELACNCTALYQSVMGGGTISILKDKNEMIHGLNIIMKQMLNKETFEYHEKALDAMYVFKLVVDEISCKENV